MPLRVLVCNETPIIQDGLQAILEAEPDLSVVGTTDSGIHAMVLERRLRPDVILTGPHLQGLSGLELIRRLGTEALEPQPRFVVLIPDDEDELLDNVLRTGVSGLLFQSAAREDLVAAVRAAGRDQITLAPPVTRWLVDWFRRQEPVADRLLQPAVEELTPREREVLLLIALGMSAEEVAAHLAIGIATARTHLYRLRCKLEVRDRAQLVSFAYRSGLVQLQRA
ncbi:LuxR C-terminal-related transcriptional regulator [Kitasatospora sp. NPDC057223]|uniref:LuxR C-terminal-related transcriptional regulator n=1 Tax=Kitasatospora sp. NPDC057223 TaxID=3346055 RepID=UPI003634B4B0